jgi:hypothetical protein
MHFGSSQDWKEKMSVDLHKMYGSDPAVQSAMKSVRDLILQRIETLLMVDEETGNPIHVKMKGKTPEEALEVVRTESGEYIKHLKSEYPNMFEINKECVVHPDVQINTETLNIDVNIFLRATSSDDEGSADE